MLRESWYGGIIIYFVVMKKRRHSETLSKKYR